MSSHNAYILVRSIRTAFFRNKTVKIHNHVYYGYFQRQHFTRYTCTVMYPWFYLVCSKTEIRPIVFNKQD